MKISYNWLSELVHLTLKPQELAERLTMVGLAVEAIERHGDDHLLDIDLTSNRPDALSHLGVAREAAIICGTGLKPQVRKLTESDEAVDAAAAGEIHDPGPWPRYPGAARRRIQVGPAP